MAPKSAAAPKPPPVLSDSPAAVQQRANSAGIGEFELPKAGLVKLAKGSIPDNIKMQQDVVLALLRGSTTFISYLTATAHDQAIARSGKSVTASDVLKAITDLDFGPSDALLPLLEHELAAFRAITAANKASKAKIAAASRAKVAKQAKDSAGDVEMGGNGEEGDEAEDDEAQGDEVDAGEEDLEGNDDDVEVEEP